MKTTAKTCIHTKHIDSYQKLRVLLYLYEHPEIKESPKKLAQRLHLGDLDLMERIIKELQQVGYLEDSSTECALSRLSAVELNLQCLQAAFQNPVRRQKLLNEVNKSLMLVGDPSDKTEFIFTCEACPLFPGES